MPNHQSATPRIRRAIKVILANVAIAVALLLVVNVAAAVTLRAYDAYARPKSLRAQLRSLPNYGDTPANRTLFREMDHLGDVEYESFVGWKTKPFRGKTLNIHSSGDRAVPGGEGGSRPRVVRFFGGSTMIGAGVDDAGTIPARYSALDPTAEVHNHAAIGLNARQNLERVLNLVATGEPVGDVVFYFGINDVGSLCVRDASLTSDLGAPRVKQLIERTGADNAKKLAYDVLVGQTAAALRRVVSPARSPENLYSCATDPERARAALAVLEKTLVVANEVVSAHGGRFLAVLQPVSFIGAPRVNHVAGVMKTEGQLGEQFKMMYPQLQRRIAELNAPWLRDVSGAFDGSDYIYWDWAHVSFAGNQIIAARVHDLLA